ncbi:ABC transporter ATP-binding protein [Rathayibacter toxicus]|uniref:ABC transporter ATP-binding protein n=1 Tax=Rathayibacter toxicus TaxID=145458 RepID=A0A2S5Y5T0_9MICO|nr:ATP-binding cassette domain-containing protein [Rathayibacter toxicus]AJM77794.1 ABC transporter ATP-binding protein [Rathayibacter toxicus]ALS58030.1 ABC transporter ATP-binding protein [Rathayibacter toxicus]PPG20284.1 ABC transporter ATP-binding protein [Rathayibacter toxicus]PPG45383.1 ABC transporter ATP-binding protein [Rathayibacter toxicus]PPH22486.1 ABC transporter ATP-binding protein [Rathayibacter toxicus]
MITLDRVTKHFGTRIALDDVSFDIHSGRTTGFVGSNGAGKTTTMRILMGVLAADSGQVLRDGRAVTPRDTRGFGYMPEERGLYAKMRVLEHVVYLGRLRGMSRAGATASAKALLERLDLDARGGDAVETLSLGNQQRAQIAGALVHSPDVLVLDEPFSGLDPVATETVVGVLAEYVQRGSTILMSSHQLDLVERLCDDVVFIDGGKVRVWGDKAQLRRRHTIPTWDIVVAAGAERLPGTTDAVQVIEREANRVRFTGDDASAQKVLRDALQYGDVLEFRPVLPTLSEIMKESAK